MMGKRETRAHGTGEGQFALRHIVRFKITASSSHKIGVQLICELALPVQTADPRMSTISICPKPTEIVPYNNPFLIPRALSSDANVLTVVRHPQ